MAERSGRYVEWRVTGDHADPAYRQAVPAYDFVWSARTTPHLSADNTEIETAAHAFAAQMREHGALGDIRVWRRVVTVTHWTQTDG